MNVPPISMARVIPRVSLGSMGPDYTASPPDWLWQVKSKDEAIEWASRCPAADGDVLEIRQVFEASHFGPEVARKEAALFDEIGERVDENKKRPTP